MNVALAHDHLNQFGGAEQVLSEFHSLYPKAPVFTLLYDKAAVGRYFADWDIRSSFIEGLPGGYRFFKWYLALMPTAVEQLNFSPYDLVISSASALIKGIVVKPQTTHVCYCHTPTRYLWSDALEYTSELPHPWFVKKVLPLLLTRLRVWDYTAAQRVDHFVANSKFVAERIAKYYRREAQVIYPPVHVERFTELADPEDYFLLVSRLRPYKRVDLAIRAFNKLGMKFKVVGSGEQEGELRAMAKPNIEFVGQVSEAEKARLLARCRALIFPQEEDFGITAVEAMASGRPVIAYRAGGALEIVKDGVTGKFFDEQSWEALADAVIRFRYESYKPEVIQRAAQVYSTTHFAEVWQDFVVKVTTR
jgi:glycosyltransferase involved in cell wall biosynthesis